jgi:hypothetical protein
MTYRRFYMIVFGLFALACGEPLGPEAQAVFEVEVVEERFRVGVNDPAQIDSFAARLASGAEANISGTLAAGPGGLNAPWSWHLDPESAHVAAVTAEVCDGRPSMVEGELDYWLGTVKQYCPWGAKVVARVR